jgi:membrane protein DedA with SNARE-associated domain
MTALVANYGYLAVFAGALLEGEALLIAAGFAARHGLLDLRLVVAFAALGAVMGDHSWFLIGRWKGRDWIARFPALAANAAGIRAVLNRYAATAAFVVRFLYGVRAAGSAFLGAAGTSVTKFAIFNVLGAAIWAIAFACAGYLLGTAAEVGGDLRHSQGILLLVLLAGGSALMMAPSVRTWRAASSAGACKSELPQKPKVAGDAGAGALYGVQRR